MHGGCIDTYPQSFSVLVLSSGSVELDSREEEAMIYLMDWV